MAVEGRLFLNMPCCDYSFCPPSSSNEHPLGGAQQQSHARHVRRRKGLYFQAERGSRSVTVRSNHTSAFTFLVLGVVSKESNDGSGWLECNL